MNVEHLDRLFHPQSVAVVGASDRDGSVGRGVLTNLLAGGFSGPVFPVNSRRDTVMGIKAYRSVSTLPMVVDMAVICTPANTLPALVSDCGKAGIGGLVILSAGFRETGSPGAMLEEELQIQAKPFPGMRMIGPNSLGVIVPGSKLNASFATTMPRPGSVAFISQSGALVQQRSRLVTPGTHRILLLRVHRQHGRCHLRRHHGLLRAERRHQVDGCLHRVNP